MIKTVSTTEAPAAIGPYSQGKIACGLLFLSGQIPIDPKTGEKVDGDIVTQTERVIKNISALLSEAKTSFKNVVKTTCFLTDLNDFARFNEVYAKYFTEKPARSTFQVSALPKGCNVEIEAVAVVE